MNKLDLFQEALFSICTASDMEEMLAGKGSVQLEQMVADGIDEDMAFQQIMITGMAATQAAQAYLNCFEVFGCEPEFDQWSQEEEHFETAMNRVAEAVRMISQNDKENYFGTLLYKA